jgi:hypothetical protein
LTSLPALAGTVSQSAPTDWTQVSGTIGIAGTATPGADEDVLSTWSVTEECGEDYINDDYHSMNYSWDTTLVPDGLYVVYVAANFQNRTTGEITSAETDGVLVGVHNSNYSVSQISASLAPGSDAIAGGQVPVDVTVQACTTSYAMVNGRKVTFSAEGGTLILSDDITCGTSGHAFTSVSRATAGDVTVSCLVDGTVVGSTTITFQEGTHEHVEITNKALLRSRPRRIGEPLGVGVKWVCEQERRIAVKYGALNTQPIWTKVDSGVDETSATIILPGNPKGKVKIYVVLQAHVGNNWVDIPGRFDTAEIEVR